MGLAGWCSESQLSIRSHQSLRLTMSSNPAFATKITSASGQAGLKVEEVASYEHSRIHGVSNLRAASDGWPRSAHHSRRALLLPPAAKAQNKHASETLLHNHERVVMRESASQPGAGAGSSAHPAPFLHD